MVADGTWTIDPERSRVGFAGSHIFGLGRVRGRFTDFSGEIVVAGGDLSAATSTIAAASFATDNERRDEDVRSSAFLDVETHPEITYATSAIEAQGDDRYRVAGTLTVKGNSAEVPLNAKVGESDGSELRLRALGTFSRRDVGVTPGAKALIVGRLIAVELELVATRAA